MKRRMIRLVSAVLIMCMASQLMCPAVIAAGNAEITEEMKEVLEPYVELSASEMLMQVKDSLILRASVIAPKVELPAQKGKVWGNINKNRTQITKFIAHEVQFSSSDEAVAIVDENGKVTGVGKGTATITATSVSEPDASASCKVIVRNKLVTGITLPANYCRVATGGTYQIVVSGVVPSDADIKTLSYTSSHPEIATVNENGLVTAVSEGEAKITIAATDGSGTETTFTVYVRKYVRNSKYYPIEYTVTIPSGGYNVSTANIGMKVIYINKKLLGTTDASYTSTTKNAVKKFQKNKGLAQTGVVDLATWLAMGYTEDQWYNLAAYLTPITTTVYSTKEDYINRMLEVAKEYADKKTVYRIGCSGPPGTYADCSGLIYQCLYAIGINPKYNIIHHGLAEYEYTSRYLAADTMLGPTVSQSNIQPGDLVYYCRNGRTTVCHIAIYAGNGLIYDSWPSIGVTKRSINIVGYYVCKVMRVIE